MNTNYETYPEDLIAEHFGGRYSGWLGVAQDVLLRLRATMGMASDEEIAEAALADGLSESEIGAALALESGEYVPVADPRGAEWGFK